MPEGTDHGRGSESLEVSEEDAAFILGKGGKTKQKLARVSGCGIELLDEGGEGSTLEFVGTAAQRKRAIRYVKCVMAQRLGAVTVTAEDVADDCTVLEVPKEAVGFVTGSKGNFLRTLEEEHTTIMFFADGGVDDRRSGGEDVTDLMIFGSRVARRGAQLAVMGVVETKMPGHYTDAFRERGDIFERKADLHGDWGTTTMELTQEELSYAIGQQGRTRKKVGRASECITQYVGNVVFLSGTRKQRENAAQYITWLLEGLEGPLNIEFKGRRDATVVEVPEDCVGYVTGRSREALSSIEEKNGTLMFFMGQREDVAKSNPDKTERLAIFGPDRARRASELTIMSSVERKREGYYTSSLRDKKSNSRGFDTDCLTLESEEMAYVTGKEGQTRMKLAAASNAILTFVGPMAFIAGTAQERQRCRDYLGFLLEQKEGRVNTGIWNRQDVLVSSIGEEDVRWLVGGGLNHLRNIELESCTFCCMTENSGGTLNMLICGYEEGSAYSDVGRLKAERMMKRLCEDPRNRREGGGWRRDRSRSRNRGWRGGKIKEQPWQSVPDVRSSSSKAAPWEKKQETRSADTGTFNAWGGGGGGSAYPRDSNKSSQESSSPWNSDKGTFNAWGGGGGGRSAYPRENAAKESDRGRPAPRGAERTRSRTPPWKRSTGKKTPW